MDITSDLAAVRGVAGPASIRWVSVYTTGVRDAILEARLRRRSLAERAAPEHVAVRQRGSPSRLDTQKRVSRHLPWISFARGTTR